MTGKTLWEEFNLRENNPDPGGGILYCMRYDAGRIRAHHESVVSALKGMGIGLEDAGEIIEVVPKVKLSGSEIRRVNTLLEELSVLNEAQEYIEVGLENYRNVEDLKNGLIGAYVSLLDDRRQVDAYNLVSTLIPQIVEDVTRSYKQNGRVLSRRGLEVLDDLCDFAVRYEQLMNNPGGFVVIGLR